MHQLLRKLEGRDRRSIGRSEEVVEDVLREPVLLGVLIEGIFRDDAVVRMRASDALEKVSRQNAEYVLPYKQKLIELAANESQNEVRWHLAQILPRLELNHEENKRVIKVFLNYLTGNSSIVNACVMQAFADIAEVDSKLRPELLVHIKELSVIGTPAMKARGRKLLARFNG